MEKMPYRQELDVHFPQRTIDPVITTITTDWRQALPVLTGSQVTLRQLRASDAPSLCALLTTEEVSRSSAAADDGRRLRAVHCLDAAAAAGGRVCLLRGDRRQHGHRDWNLQLRELEPGSAPRNGDSRSGQRIGARECSRKGLN
jgi:hypothetical protein